MAGVSNRFECAIQDLSEYPDKWRDEWIYAGGDWEHHLNYYEIKFRKLDTPAKKKHCICGVRIVRNCYLENIITKNLIVVGSCCIQKFIPKDKAGRTCEICKCPHRNTKDNYCKDCRTLPICNMCGKLHNNMSVYCGICLMLPRCNDCTVIVEDFGEPYCRMCKYLILKRSNILVQNVIGNAILKYKKQIDNAAKSDIDKSIVQCRSHERREINSYDVKSSSSSSTPRGKRKLTFGKHKGLSFEEVLVREASYCLWFINNTDGGEFLNFCESNVDVILDSLDNETVTFGKYKGLSFEEVLVGDIGYCRWSSLNTKSDFAYYCRYRLDDMSE